MSTIANQQIRSVLKGTLYATAVTLSLVLLLALVVQFGGLGETVLLIVTQICKFISIFFGVGIGLKYIDKKGWLFGALIGILYTVCVFFLFSIINTSFNITTGLLVELLLAVFLGVASAMLLRMGRTTA